MHGIAGRRDLTRASVSGRVLAGRHARGPFEMAIEMCLVVKACVEGGLRRRNA